MAKKKDEIPDWVSDEIQNTKFEKAAELKKTGYILEFYDTDNKIDVQLYDPVEDGRHIVTLTFLIIPHLKKCQNTHQHHLVLKQ